MDGRWRVQKRVGNETSRVPQDSRKRGGSIVPSLLFRFVPSHHTSRHSDVATATTQDARLVLEQIYISSFGSTSSSASASPLL